LGLGESYSYKALDVKNEEDKKFFEAAMAWDLVVDGKEVSFFSFFHPFLRFFCSPLPYTSSHADGGFQWADGKNFK
jgi:hypothetical protein